MEIYSTSSKILMDFLGFSFWEGSLYFLGGKFVFLGREGAYKNSVHLYYGIGGEAYPQDNYSLDSRLSDIWRTCMVCEVELTQFGQYHLRGSKVSETSKYFCTISCCYYCVVVSRSSAFSAQDPCHPGGY